MMLLWNLLLAPSLVWAHPPGTYAHYTLPSGTAHDMEVDHFWTSIPRPDQTQGNAVFASMQFWMENGVGGYFGTQVWREGADPQQWRNGSKQLLGTRIGADEVHQAIFSCWDKDASHQVTWEGDNCERFGGEGVGSHCVVHYPMEPGKKYTIGIKSSDGVKWTGTLTDLSTGTVTTMGTLVYPDTPGYKGFGLLKTQGAAFQEYYAASGCDGQPFSAVGLIGPYFNSRSLSPTAATPSYADCKWSDVDACIQPGEECGPPRVFMMAGGTTDREQEAGEQLWTSPYPGTEVSCGGHSADSCENCPQNQGAAWCSGQCHWANDKCTDTRASNSSSVSAAMMNKFTTEAPSLYV